LGRATEPVAECPSSQGAADVHGGGGQLVAGEHCLGGIGERLGDRLAVIGGGGRPLCCGVIEGQRGPGDGRLVPLPRHRKLSASAALRKPSFHSRRSVFQRTLYVVTFAPLYTSVR